MLPANPFIYFGNYCFPHFAKLEKMCGNIDLNLLINTIYCFFFAFICFDKELKNLVLRTTIHNFSAQKIEKFFGIQQQGLYMCVETNYKDYSEDYIS